MLLIAVMIALGADPVTAAERDMTSYCRSTRRNDEVSRPGSTRILKETGLCFSGEIDAAAAQKFVADLGMLGATPIIVVNSGGGDVDAGLHMAEAVATRRATVIVDGVCASSCANYLLPAGSRRVIWGSGVLAFHGGAVQIPDGELRRILQPIVPPDQMAATVESVHQENAGRLARQARFEDAVGMHGFFDGMSELNALPPAEKHELCADETASSLVFSDDRLRNWGLILQVNYGPKSGSELSDALRANGATWTACYIQ